MKRVKITYMDGCGETIECASSEIRENVLVLETSNNTKTIIPLHRIAKIIVERSKE